MFTTAAPNNVPSAAPTPGDQALVMLLAMEEGAAVPLRSAAGPDPFPQLFAEKLVQSGPGGRYVLTAAGRSRAIAARTRIRAGALGGCPLKAVR